MAGYKEHLTWGFLFAGITGAILYFLFGINILERSTLVTLLVVTALFSLLPDVDHKISNISWFLHFISAIAVISLLTKRIPFNFQAVLILVSLAGLEIYHWKYARGDEKARQFPHTYPFLGLALIDLFLITFSWLAVLFGAVAFLSHIFIDYNPKVSKMFYNGNYCKICGRRCNKYPLCFECNQKRKQNNKVNYY